MQQRAYSSKVLQYIFAKKLPRFVCALLKTALSSTSTCFEFFWRIFHKEQLRLKLDIYSLLHQVSVAHSAAKWNVWLEKAFPAYGVSPRKLQSSMILFVKLLFINVFCGSRAITSWTFVNEKAVMNSVAIVDCCTVIKHNALRWYRLFFIYFCCTLSILEFIVTFVVTECKYMPIWTIAKIFKQNPVGRCLERWQQI